MKNALTKNLERHRAAIRINEGSDCLALMISEEKDRISMTECSDAELNVPLDRVKQALSQALALALWIDVAREPELATTLPLTTNASLLAELGTRHRAGIGITEEAAAVEGSSAVPQSGFH